MNKQFQVVVQRIDNGFLIGANTDDGKRWRLSASDEEDTKTKLREIIDHMFDKVEKKKKPEDAPAV